MFRLTRLPVCKDCESLDAIRFVERHTFIIANFFNTMSEEFRSKQNISHKIDFLLPQDSNFPSNISYISRPAGYSMTTFELFFIDNIKSIIIWRNFNHWTTGWKNKSINSNNNYKGMFVTRNEIFVIGENKENNNLSQIFIVNDNNELILIVRNFDLNLNLKISKILSLDLL